MKDSWWIGRETPHARTGLTHLWQCLYQEWWFLNRVYCSLAAQHHQQRTYRRDPSGESSLFLSQHSFSYTVLTSSCCPLYFGWVTTLVADFLLEGIVFVLKGSSDISEVLCLEVPQTMDQLFIQWKGRRRVDDFFLLSRSLYAAVEMHTMNLRSSNSTETDHLDTLHHQTYSTLHMHFYFLCYLVREESWMLYPVLGGSSCFRKALEFSV